MTTGGTIFFKNLKEKKQAIKKLKKVNLFGIPFIDIEVKKDSIFYNLNLRFKDKIIENPKNYKVNEIIKLIKNNKKTIKKSKLKNYNLELSYKLLEEFAFIKTTSIHSTNGSVFYSGLKRKLPKKILNHELFHVIKEYYS